MSQKFVQVRGSGAIYYWTPILEARGDVDIIHADDDATPDSVAQALAAKSRPIINAPEVITLETKQEPKDEKPAPKKAAVALPPGVTVTEA